MDKLTVSRHVNGSTTFKVQINGKGPFLVVGSLESIAQYFKINHFKIAKQFADADENGTNLPEEVEFCNVEPSERKKLAKLIGVEMR